MITSGYDSAMTTASVKIPATGILFQSTTVYGLTSVQIKIFQFKRRDQQNAR